MKIANLMTPKRIEQYSCWVPSAFAFATAGFVTLVYFTDWKVIVTKIPFYGSKVTKERQRYQY